MNKTKSILFCTLSKKKVHDSGDQMAKHFLYVLFLALTALVHAQDQSGFISIDCGISDNSSYIDATTGISYVSDAEYTDSGVSRTISPQYMTNNLEKQFSNVRSFPEGIKNCYTLTLPQANGQNKYLVRARFMHGNYDAKNQVPEFDIYLGVDYWDTVKLSTNRSKVLDLEIIHVFSSYYTHVCLVNTGQGTPFISALELRPVDKGIYVTESGSLALFGRYDMRSYSDNDPVFIRYEDDNFDRIWAPPFASWAEVSTSLTISPDKHQNIFKVPSSVMRTAITPRTANGSLQFYWSPADPDTKYYIYMHFTEVELYESREFNIYLNDTLWYDKPVRPDYLTTFTVYSTGPSVATWFNFTINKTEKSTLPPVLNALELYKVKNLSSLLQTDQGDVDAIKSIKSAYGVKKNWQGDPCIPNDYSWEGLNCINGRSDPPRIISLNLSWSGLTGKISASIFNLSMLQYLDLSNNSLTGDVPDFLTLMQKLTVLNLTGNNLTGTVPTELIKRSENGSLSLSTEGNPHLCKLEPCETKPENDKKKKNNILVPIVAVVAAVAILVVAIAIWWMFILKRRKQKQQQVASVATEAPAGANRGDAPLNPKKQQFTYAEVLKITGNFQRALGKGGFGTVYHGYLEDIQVAVKMLSPSSGQGYKQFKAEAEILMRVHHRNLTSLVGYCDEGDNMGLIYEYMANGDLHKHLSDKNKKLLSWETRLEIARDAAQGLEYLHTGCTPPIIHRDVKSTNILLNHEYLAKLADFGLSKAFQVGGTHVSTTFAGTPGYLDPEYNLNEKSDVFSFGVVLLEIITSKPAISRMPEQIHISQWVSRMLNSKGDVRDVVDPRLDKDYDLNSVWKAVDVAMECVSDSSFARPTMNHVVTELKRCLGMEQARMKKGYWSESNNNSGEMSSLNIDTTGMNPRAR